MNATKSTLARSAWLLATALLLIGATLAAQEEGHRVFLAGAHYYKLVVTDSEPAATNTTTWQDVPRANPAGSAYAIIQPNSTALVNVRFTAESRCTESGSSAPNWCEVRILVGGTEASPRTTGSPSPYAFDSTDSGNATAGAFESHAMDRHVCVPNPTAQTRAVGVQVQWQVTNTDGGAAPSFWLDDWSLTIESARALSCPSP